MQAAFATFLALLGLGYVARRTGWFPERFAEALNRFVIDLCLPAAILRLLPKLTLRLELLVLAITPWVVAACAYVLVRVGARLFAWDRQTSAVMFLCTALGNTAFLGFPLCGALLGEDAVPLAAVYDQFGSFMVLATVGLTVVARAAGRDTPSLREVARRFVTFPPFIALVVALLPLPRPAWLEALLAQLAGALVPVAIFAVGLRTRLVPPRGARDLAVGLLLKMGLLPLVAWAVARLFGASEQVLSVAVLQTAMPTMVTAGVLAVEANLAPELAAALVSWGIVLSLATVRTWAWLVS